MLAGAAILPQAALVRAQAAPQGPVRTFNIGRQSLAGALNSFGRQAGIEVVFDPSVVRGRHSVPTHGPMKPDAALRHILIGTKLGFHVSAAGAYVIEAVQDKFTTEATTVGGVPEILVRATKQEGWTLNTDVRRTIDDPQPYQIFTRADIQRSGAVDLEGFFHNFLNASTSVGSSTTSPAAIGRSSISLRGLGTGATLILVDGRRLPGVSIPALGSISGEIGQGQITGIPLDSIERIEVLASSASGIYGANAAGGVINIITRHDYRGLRVTGTFGDGVNGGPIDRRIDLSGGLSLEGGRTNVSFTGTWRNTGSLLIGDRAFYDEANREAIARDPRYYLTQDNPPLGTTPNIHSTTGAILTLKPQYGGGSLGSAFTSLPTGYRGVGLDGVAALIANAGKYNLDLAPTAIGGGKDAPLVSGSKLLSGNIAVRREMNSWLRIYAQADGSISRTETPYSAVPTGITVKSKTTANGVTVDNPANPFQQDITVVEAAPSMDAQSHSKQTSLIFTAGAIFTLPHDWSSNADVSWSQNKYTASDQHYLTTASYTGLSNGALNPLVDTLAYPLTYALNDVPSNNIPSATRNIEASLRTAGPLPVKLPGGKPILTTLLQFNRNTVGTGYSWSNQPTTGQITYYPARSRNSYSAYGELTLPIIGEGNHIPLFQAFEIDAAGRFDRFVEKSLYQVTSTTLPGFGTSNSGNAVPTCFTNNNGSLPTGFLNNLASLCNLPGMTPISTSKSIVNPTISAKWTTTRDIVFRGSFSKGYQPLYLSQLYTNVGLIAAGGKDPLRGGEQIGIGAPNSICPTTTTCLFQGKSGGNPNLKPQTSTSFSAGTILTPRWLPGLRLSVDWTLIRLKDVYFSPASLFQTGQDTLLAAYLADHPDRIARGAPSGGFAVGPIVSVDESLDNLSFIRSEAIDLAGDYDWKLAKSRITLSARATYLRSLRIQNTPGSPVQEFAGVVGSAFSSGITSDGGLAGLRWHGNAQLIWSNDKASIGLRALYYGSYWLNVTHTVDQFQNSAKIASQWYFDIFGSYKIGRKMEIRAGMNDFLNTKPRFDFTQTGSYYSRVADPRQANFYLAISRAL